MPTGCHTGLGFRKASIRRVPGGAAQSSAAANTRLTLAAASRSNSARAGGSMPDRSIALTSICPASTGASSPVRPVSTLTTPAGTSEVASTSDRVIDGSGRGSLATTTAVLPVAITGASTLTSPSRLDSAGAMTATTPVGSGTLKLKYGPATAFAAPATWATLSGQPAYQTQRSTAAVTCRPAFQHLGDPVQNLATVVGRRAGPLPEGSPRSCDGIPGVLARGLRRARQHRAVCRAHRVGPAGLRPWESPGDVQLVGLANVQPLGPVSRTGPGPPVIGRPGLDW